MNLNTTEKEPSLVIARALLTTMAWPAAAAISLSVAVGGREVTGTGLLLVACGTMVAYGLDRLIDNRKLDPVPLRRALIFFVIVAAAGAGLLACTSLWRLEVCAGLGLIAGAYVPLKRFIPKNLLTTFAWTAAIATLPFASQPPITPAFHTAVLSVALIMAANTVLCDIPDFTADRQAGVRGITPRFGPKAGGSVALSLGILGAYVSGSAGRWSLAITSAGLAVLAVLMMRNPSRRLFRLLADAIVTILPGPLSLLFH